VVTLKQVKRTDNPYEVDIGLYFSSEPLVSQPANHCVPIYDVLALNGDEDITLVVMPLLRVYTNPNFDTIGEGVECFRQLFEVTWICGYEAYTLNIFQGLQFMHQHRVAHRCVEPQASSSCINISTVIA
jgi:hypothetical protein